MSRDDEHGVGNSPTDSESDDEFESADKIDRESNSVAISSTEFQVVELFQNSDVDLNADDEHAPEENRTPYRKLLASMNHINCSSHMLDKIGSKDALKAKQHPEYNAKYEQVFEKT